MAKAKRKPALPKINWKPEAKLPSGSSYWETLDGQFRLVASECLYEVQLPRAYRLWMWKGGAWLRIAEGRSRPRMEKILRARLAAQEADDD